MIDAQRKLRRRGLDARRKLDREERHLKSSKISSAFLSSRLFFSATRIGIYLSADDEVDTGEIILRCWRANKRVFAPIIGRNRKMLFAEIRRDTLLRRNRFGLFEPSRSKTVSPGSLDVIVTPIVAFDDELNRIGMGGGYFDTTFRFLKHAKAYRRPKLAALAFSCQQVKKIPANPWDIPVYKIFTE